MAIYNITWSPAAGSSTSQDVQYKAASSSVWIQYSNVSPITSTAAISGLQDNILYDFRIVSNCSFGGSSESMKESIINILCPNLTLTPGTTTIAYLFNNSIGDITLYTVDLLDALQTTVLETQSPPVANTVSGTFSGLASNVSYNIKVTVTAGLYNKVCPSQSSTTLIPPCNPPTGLTVTIS